MEGKILMAVWSWVMMGACASGAYLRSRFDHSNNIEKYSVEKHVVVAEVKKTKTSRLDNDRLPKHLLRP